MLDFYNIKTPKARKEHKCDLCEGTIQKGETYCRFSGKYDGDMFDDKYHLVCREIINTYCEKTNNNEYHNDYIYDWLRDEYCLDCPHYNEDCEECALSCSRIKKIFEKGE